MSMSKTVAMRIANRRIYVTYFSGWMVVSPYRWSDIDGTTVETRYPCHAAAQSACARYLALLAAQIMGIDGNPDDFDAAAVCPDHGSARDRLRAIFDARNKHCAKV